MWAQDMRAVRKETLHAKCDRIRIIWDAKKNPGAEVFVPFRNISQKHALLFEGAAFVCANV